MKKLIILVFISASLPLFCAGEESESKKQSSTAIPGSNMNIATQEYEAKILKVYTAESEKGTRYNGYVVNWNGSEVVVSDMFGGETKKEGEMIKFMVQEMDMPGFDAKSSEMKMRTIIQFIVSPGLEIEE